MKVAVVCTTRDRLLYTKHCLGTLFMNAGHPFDLYIYDNGSTDGTQDWIVHNEHLFTYYVLNDKNIGLGGVFYHMQQVIKDRSYNLVITFDNDCEVITDGIIRRIVNFYKHVDDMEHWLLSANVQGLTYPPEREPVKKIAGENLCTVTSNIGCIFMIRTKEGFLRELPQNTNLAFSPGDSELCKQHRRLGGQVAILEDLLVNHYETTEGQKARYPEYWQRKLEENRWT